MDRVESIRRRLRQMHQSHSDGSESRLLISIDDVTNNVLFYRIRLDDCERSFTHRLKFSSPVSHPTSLAPNLLIIIIRLAYLPCKKATSQLEKVRASSCGRNTPRSVMTPVIYSAGVTSKSGLYTWTPDGATGWLPWMEVTSVGLRCSIGISSPDLVLRSIVE